MTNKHKMLAVSYKIKKQFPRTREGALFHAIIERALLDLVSDFIELNEKESAIEYVNSEMYHADACDIESGWIRRLINEVGLGFYLLSVKEQNKIRLDIMIQNWLIEDPEGYGITDEV